MGDSHPLCVYDNVLAKTESPFIYTLLSVEFAVQNPRRSESVEGEERSQFFRLLSEEQRLGHWRNGPSDTNMESIRDQVIHFGLFY